MRGNSGFRLIAYPIPMAILVSGHADYNSFKHVGLIAEDVLAYSRAAATTE
jgi:hypothetical protein